jgi:hypothetical protein
MNDRTQGLKSNPTGNNPSRGKSNEKGPKMMQP